MFPQQVPLIAEARLVVHSGNDSGKNLLGGVPLVVVASRVLFQPDRRGLEASTPAE